MSASIKLHRASAWPEESAVVRWRWAPGHYSEVCSTPHMEHGYPCVQLHTLDRGSDCGAVEALIPVTKLARELLMVKP